MKTRSIIYFLAAIFFLSCEESKKESAKTGQVEEIVEQTRTEFAPDKRVALFDISAEEDKNGIILKGETINYFKILLTYCVPYCVTTWGAIHGKRVKLL